MRPILLSPWLIPVPNMPLLVLLLLAKKRCPQVLKAVPVSTAPGAVLSEPVTEGFQGPGWIGKRQILALSRNNSLTLGKPLSGLNFPHL